MSYQVDLKKFLPEAQQGNLSLDQFMDSIGELLDGFKTAIDGFQDYNDFQEITEDNLELLAAQFNVAFPRNMSLSRKRGYLREIITLYRSKGTIPAMKRVFRLIGWDVTIEEQWIVDPAWYVDSNPYTLQNNAGQSVDLSLYDKITHVSTLTNNNETFLTVKDNSGNQYTDLHIYGDDYKITPAVSFMKVPYLKIKVTSEDFDIFTQDYTVDGNLYSYTSSEEFDILENIRSYFLQRERPANVAIIEISTPFGLEDTITYTLLDDTAAIVVSGTPNISFENVDPDTITRNIGSWLTDGFLPEMTITVTNSTSTNDGTYKVKEVTATVMTLYPQYTVATEAGNTTVTITGDGFTITTENAGIQYDGHFFYGIDTDPYILGETMGGILYGDSHLDYWGVDQDAPDQNYTRSYAIGTSGDQSQLPLRKSSDMVVTVPADAVVDILTTTSSRAEIEAGTETWTFLETVANQIGYTVVLTSKFSAKVNITTASSTATIDLTINLY